VSVAVYKAFSDAKAGTSKPGQLFLGFAEDGVDYSMDEFNRKLITPEIEAKLQQAKADIIAGKIKVTEYKAAVSRPKPAQCELSPPAGCPNWRFAGDGSAGNRQALRRGAREPGDFVRGRGRQHPRADRRKRRG